MIQSKTRDVQVTYNRIAEEYARRIYDELRHKPLDRQLLDRFAASVPDSAGVVCELGCGPGQVARYLQGRGLQVRGMDMSEEMLTHARQLNPGITFEPGDMRALPVKDNSWAGIVAFYAIVNLQSEEIPQVFREMIRVLIPGGQLLLSFHVGDDTLHVEDNVWGCGVTLETTFFRVSTISDFLREAGFTIGEIIEREPYAPEVEYQSRRAYIFAQKPRTKITSA